MALPLGKKASLFRRRNSCFAGYPSRCREVVIKGGNDGETAGSPACAAPDAPPSDALPGEAMMLCRAGRKGLPPLPAPFPAEMSGTPARQGDGVVSKS